MDECVEFLEALYVSLERNQGSQIVKEVDEISQQKGHQKNLRTREVSLLQVPLIKSSQISIQVKQPTSVSLFFDQNHCRRQNSPSKFRDQTKTGRQSRNLRENIFSGSNPGIFYSHQIQFDPESNGQSIKTSASLINLQQEEAHFSNKEINKIDKFPENTSQKSGTTIIDLETQKELEQTQFQKIQELSSSKAEFTQIPINAFKKSKPQPQLHLYVPLKKPDNHSKHSPVSLLTEKSEKDFVVPIIINKATHNKSKYIKNEYLNIKDENLTNFFTTREKKIYLENLTSSKSSLFNSCIYSLSSPDNCQFKKLTFFENKSQSVSNFKSSFFGISIHKEKFFDGIRDQQKQDNFDALTIKNTKFLVKTLPSQKNRKFFNQSISTLINYNYRPLTSRKKLIKTEKQNSIPEELNTKITEKTFQGSNQGLKQNSPNLKQNCNYWAQINSFQKMGQNSKKSKKACEVQVNSLKDKNVVQQQKLKKSFTVGISEVFQQNKENTILQQSQNFTKLRNSTVLQMETIRNNNIKRVKRFEKSVLSKLSIVSKMGVKLTRY